MLLRVRVAFSALNATGFAAWRQLMEKWREKSVWAMQGLRMKSTQWWTDHSISATHKISIDEKNYRENYDPEISTTVYSSI